MIVKISQTASNLKQLYEIESEGFYFQGENGSLNKWQNIILYNQDTTIKGVYEKSHFTNYIPLRYIFGEANLTRGLNLYLNDNIYGSIVFSKHGFLKSFYVIALDSGEVFHCYTRSKGSFDYVCIYQEEKQIALVETYLNVNDYKYTHKLYVLDDYHQFADTLSLFVLYYANYNFAKRFHMNKGSVCEKRISHSKYNDKYNPSWRETYFPDENFFGKTCLM